MSREKLDELLASLVAERFTRYQQPLVEADSPDVCRRRRQELADAIQEPLSTPVRGWEAFCRRQGSQAEAVHSALTSGEETGNAYPMTQSSDTA